MIKVLSGDLCGRVIADGEPHLRAMPRIQVIRRSRPSHLGCYPAGLKSIGENVWPAARDGEGQKRIVQLGIGVSLLSLPRAVLLCQILQAGIAALVQAGTQIDQSLWPPNQCGQDIRRERVDGEYLGQAVFGHDAPRLPVADACIVDHRIEGAERVDLFRDFAGLSDTRQIADDDRLRLRNGGQRFLTPRLVAGVQNCAVALLDQELCGHAAESVGRTCDEYARHYFWHAFAPALWLLMLISGGLFLLRLPLEVESYAESQNDCGDAE